MKGETIMCGVRVEREESPVVIRCCGCKKMETAMLLKIIPPAGIGTAIHWLLMPNGWWARWPYMDAAGSTERPSDCHCPDCLQLPGLNDVEPEPSPTDVEVPRARLGEPAQSIKVELAQAFTDLSRVKKEGARPTSKTFEEDTWQKTLGTIDGAATVAEALAKHIRRMTTPRGPEDITECGGTSVEKVVEVLEACSARLQEFRPSGSHPTDLSILGPRPFAKRPTRGDPCCSFCGKSKRDVQTLIAGPSVHMCNECIDLCKEIVSEECAAEDAKPIAPKGS